LARADLNPELLGAITEILLAMDENDEGKAALESFARTNQFDAFPDIDKTFARIREMIKLVNEAQNK
jgi:ABC-type phosphate/phosphonate transport system substrate-binding protein